MNIGSDRSSVFRPLALRVTHLTYHCLNLKKRVVFLLYDVLTGLRSSREVGIRQASDLVVVYPRGPLVLCVTHLV